MIWIISLASAADLEVRVDPRVELVSIVFRLSGAHEYNIADDDYARAVDDHFAPYERHSAVKAARRLRIRRGIAYNAPVDLAVHLDPLLRPAVPLDPHPARLDDRWTARDAEKFLRHLRDFAADSEFATFYEDHADHRSEVEAHFREAGGDQVVSWLDGFFGPAEGASYTVIPGLLVGPNNYGVSAEIDGDVQFSPVLGPGSSGRGLQYLLVHELGHAYVNPALESRSEVLESAGESVFGHVRTHMRDQAYGDWQIVVNETGVRALTLLYALDAYGVQAGREALGYEIGRGFYWVGEVVTYLDGLRREGEVDLASAAEDLATIFAEWGAEPTYPAGFRGPINAAFERLGPGSVFVAPADLAYADAMYEHFMRKRGVERVGLDWSSDTPVAEVHYGSPMSSPALAAWLEELEITIDETGVLVDGQRFDVERPRLIITRPHPDDVEVPIVLYAASVDEDIEGINGLFHGPTDWLVASGDEVIASGDFDEDLPVLDAERLGVIWPEPDLAGLPGWLGIVSGGWFDVVASSPVVVLGGALPAYEPIVSLDGGVLEVRPSEEGRYGCEGTALTLSPLFGAPIRPGLTWLVEPGTDASALELEAHVGERHRSWKAGGHELVLMKTGEYTAELLLDEVVVADFDVSTTLMDGFETEPLDLEHPRHVPQYVAAWRVRDRTVFGGWVHSFEGTHLEVVVVSPGGVTREEISYLYSCAF